MVQASHPLKIMKKNLIVVGLILTAIQLCLATTNEIRSKRFESSIVDFQFYKKLITVENCEENVQKFTGCIEGLSQLINISFGYSGGKGLMLEGSDVISAFDHNSKKISFAFLSYVESVLKSEADIVKNNPLKMEELASERIKRLRAFYQSLYKIAKASEKKPYNEILVVLQSASGRPIPATALAKAINTYLMNAVDPHTTLVPEKTYMELMHARGEEHLGLGIQYRLSRKEGSLKGFRITEVFDHSPAQKAKLKKGDLITQINGQDINNESLEKAINDLEGNKSKDVELVIDRRGQDLQFKLTKADYKIDNVSENVIAFDGKVIGYARLGQFQMSYATNGLNKDCVELSEVFERFQRLTDGAILDLRDNRGGSVENAACIAGIFLGGGVRIAIAKKIEHQIFPSDIMKLFVKRSESDTNSETPNDIVFDSPRELHKIFDKPLIVLVNSQSANSSEMLAAALRDHNRAYVVGTQTFGKGTTMSPAARSPEPDLPAKANDQTERLLESIPEKRMMILATNYQFYSPKGLSHHGQGLSPHITAYENPKPLPQELSKMRESDLFMFPISVAPLMHYSQTSPQMMNRLIPYYGCIGDAKLPEYFEKLDEAAFERDMQVLSGAQQIVCLYQNLPKNLPPGAYPQF